VPLQISRTRYVLLFSHSWVIFSLLASLAKGHRARTCFKHFADWVCILQFDSSFLFIELFLYLIYLFIYLFIYFYVFMYLFIYLLISLFISFIHSFSFLILLFLSIFFPVVVYFFLACLLFSISFCASRW
jgi:hypothetical protein